DHFDAVVVGVPPGVGGGHAAGDVGLAGGDRGGAGRGVGHRGDLQCRVRGRLAPTVVAAVQHRGGVVVAVPGERAGSGDGFADVPGALGDDEGEGGQGGADLGVGLAGGQLQCVVAVGGGGLQVEHGQPAVVLGALALDAAEGEEHVLGGDRVASGEDGVVAQLDAPPGEVAVDGFPGLGQPGLDPALFVEHGEHVVEHGEAQVVGFVADLSVRVVGGRGGGAHRGVAQGGAGRGVLLPARAGAAGCGGGQGRGA